MRGIKHLLKPAERYRGFVNIDNSFLPLTMNLLPVDDLRVRIKNIFPTSLMGRIRKGSVLFILLEDESNSIAELRVAGIRERDILALVDFISEDRRKLPRVRVSGLLDMKAILECEGIRVEAQVEDISLTSARLVAGSPVPFRECLITFVLDGSRITLRGKVIRAEENSAVVEISQEDGTMTSLLGRVYSKLFLKMQRSLQS